MGGKKRKCVHDIHKDKWETRASFLTMAFCLPFLGCCVFFGDAVVVTGFTSWRFTCALFQAYSSSNSSENYEGGTALFVRFIGWNLLCSGLWSSRMFRGGINAGGYKYSFSVHFAFWLRHIFAGVLFLEENGFWVRGGLVERGKTVLIKCIHSEVLVRDVFNLLCHVASLLDWLFCCWADGNSEGEYGNECHTNTHKYYEV